MWVWFFYASSKNAPGYFLNDFHNASSKFYLIFISWGWFSQCILKIVPDFHFLGMIYFMHPQNWTQFSLPEDDFLNASSKLHLIWTQNDVGGIIVKKKNSSSKIFLIFTSRGWVIIFSLTDLFRTSVPSLLLGHPL